MTCEQPETARRWFSWSVLLTWALVALVLGFGSGRLSAWLYQDALVQAQWSSSDGFVVICTRFSGCRCWPPFQDVVKRLEARAALAPSSRGGSSD